MNTYSKIKIKISLFVLLINYVFLFFFMFQVDYWDNNFGSIIERVLLSSGVGLILLSIIIIVLLIFIKRLENIALFITNNDNYEESGIEPEKNILILNIFILISGILFWISAPIIINLLKSEKIFNNVFFMRLTLYLPLAFSLSSINLIFVNYLLNPLKGKLKIYKNKKVVKNGVLGRRLLLIVFIPVACITFGLNFNFNNIQNTYSKINELEELIVDDGTHQVYNSFNVIKSELKSNLNSSLTLNIVMGSIFVIIISLILLFSNLEIKKGINSLFKNIKSILNKSDFTKKIEITQYDELGELSELINLYTDVQQHNISILQNYHQSIIKGASNIEDTISSLKTETDEIDLSYKNTNKSTDNSIESIEKTKSYVEKIFGIFNELNEKVNTQIENINFISTSFKDTINNLNVISKSSSELLELVNEAIEKLEDGSRAMYSHMEVITDLSEYSEGIVEIIESINNIVKKTNLLAMNASIEAAHAGESGKGFAVVADEIKRLANSSSQNIKEIANRMGSVAEKIELGSKTISEAGNSFKTIFKMIKEINKSFKNILNLISNEEIQTKEIYKSFSNINDAIFNMKSINDKQNEENKYYEELRIQLNNVEEHIGNLKNRVEVNNESVSNKIESLEEASITYKKVIEEITEFFDKFKMSQDSNKKKQIEGNNKSTESILPTIIED